jgi:hypothetical protein
VARAHGCPHLKLGGVEAVLIREKRLEEGSHLDSRCVYIYSWLIGESWCKSIFILRINKVCLLLSGFLNLFFAAQDGGGKIKELLIQLDLGFILVYLLNAILGMLLLLVSVELTVAKPAYNEWHVLFPLFPIMINLYSSLTRNLPSIS